MAGATSPDRGARCAGLSTWSRRSGRFGRFFAQAVGYIVIPPFKLGRLVDRIHFIGFRSLIIVVLTGAFTGMVLGCRSS